MELFVFSLFALGALVSALAVVSHRNPVYATMSLVVTLVCVAALFLMLGAPFIATLQVLIYTGAIVVLFLFVIMLLNIQREEHSAPSGGAQRWAAILMGFVLAGLLFGLFWRAHAGAEIQPLTEDQVSLTRLARLLFTEYMLPFQAIGLLLLAAVVAATVLARRPDGRITAPGEESK
ncbi:MAG: NADH-quinone oxidoreductase subunit J [Acidobacteriota bacterium]